MILDIIERHTGITFTELAKHDEIRLNYNKKELSAEIDLMKKQRKIYLVKPNVGSRHLFIWRDDFECRVCEGKLPQKRPSFDDPNLCAKCRHNKQLTKPDREINEMMRDWAVLPLLTSLSPDPRGYYGGAR
jgi:hypothetical protein